MNKSNRV